MINVKDVNLNLLRFFIATAESKNLAETGEKLGYSYSTVSENISTLENQLGVKLFNRKPLELTDVGKEIYETIKRGFMDIDFAMLIADSRNDINCGKINIGCPSHIVEFYLIDVLSKVSKKYPNLKIDLDTSYECENLIEALKENKIDFAIIDRLPVQYQKDVEVKKIKKSNYIFVSNKQIIINDINELKNYKFILSGEKRENTIKLSNILKEYDIDLDVRLICGITEQRVNAAKSGIGIAYVLKEAAKKSIENKEVYEVKLPDFIKLPEVSLDLVYVKNHLTKVDKEFINEYIIKKDSN